MIRELRKYEHVCGYHFTQVIKLDISFQLLLNSQDTMPMHTNIFLISFYAGY